MKKIVLYIDPESGTKGRIFLHQVQQRLPGIRIQVCQSVETFVAAVCRKSPCMDLPVLVLFVADLEHLDDLYRRKQVFENHKVVMVVPEERAETGTAMIHRFFPRFVAAMNDRYEDLCDVLNKMMNPMVNQ